MDSKARIRIILALFAFVVFAPLAPVQAGQLFPPSNLPDPTQPCPTGSALSWVGSSGTVECVPVATSTTCGAGLFMTGISGGKATCAPLNTINANGGNYSCPTGFFVSQLTDGVPTCTAASTLNASGTNYGCPAGFYISQVTNGVTTCTPMSTTNGSGNSYGCPSGEFMTQITNGVPTCVSPSNVCSAGQALTYTAKGFVCENVDQQTVPTCGTGQFLSSNGSGGFICQNVSALNLTCPAQQALIGISNGNAVCADAPFNIACPAGQTIKSIVNGSPVCKPDPSDISCPAGQILTGISSGEPVCQVYACLGGGQHDWTANGKASGGVTYPQSAPVGGYISVLETQSCTYVNGSGEITNVGSATYIAEQCQANGAFEAISTYTGRSQCLCYSPTNCVTY